MDKHEYYRSVAARAPGFRSLLAAEFNYDWDLDWPDVESVLVNDLDEVSRAENVQTSTVSSGSWVRVSCRGSTSGSQRGRGCSNSVTAQHATSSRKRSDEGNWEAQPHRRRGARGIRRSRTPLWRASRRGSSKASTPSEGETVV